MQSGKGHQINSSQMYQQPNADERFDLEPTKGTKDYGSNLKRPREKIASQSLSNVAGGEDDEDDEVIGTHRKESLQGSQHDLRAVNRFGSPSKQSVH